MRMPDSPGRMGRSGLYSAVRHIWRTKDAVALWSLRIVLSESRTCFRVDALAKASLLNWR
ncbi:hypothetical protein GAO09_29210 [Rhizobiales bacterium RZME27]|uniref:Uncharacterized protein n=1 Tax=Endobacterium cereale TaxID=2663029 RepID=A0A6A8AGZ9_9HYPH|nr:hypothetical protein [Endobacterium cereale]MEB2845728.1 hypothetical protein [Endobacterium cereale]MQY50114.1 hypothetical protein [Endobacterium cereale]